MADFHQCVMTKTFVPGLFIKMFTRPFIVAIEPVWNKRTTYNSQSCLKERKFGYIREFVAASIFRCNGSEQITFGQKQTRCGPYTYIVASCP